MQNTDHETVLNDIEMDAYHHSYMHVARDFYKKSKINNDEPNAAHSSKVFHFLNSMLSAKHGEPVSDEHGNCTMCGKGFDQ